MGRHFTGLIDSSQQKFYNANPSVWTEPHNTKLKESPD